MTTTIVFDALGTLFDVSALDQPLNEIAATPATRIAWFERLLGSSRALTMTGRFVSFSDLAASTLAATLAQEDLDVEAAASVAAKIAEVPAYPDARPALDRASESGLDAVVLTNGGRQQTEAMLVAAGLADAVSQVFSVEEVGAYKPDPRPYSMVAGRLDIDPGQLTLVAAHGWDVLGASSAGLGAVWVDRVERRWPFPLPEPDLRAPGLLEAVDVVIRRRGITPPRCG